MGKQRLEAFSDGVIAIIITIMALELKTPHGSDFASIKPLLPVFLSYILSFIFIGIYWNNHHHMLHASKQVNGKSLWLNLHLLFWLSLVPFVTGWMGENFEAPIPVALYGGILLMSGIAYYLLSQSLVKLHGPDSTLSLSIGRDKKGVISVVLYALAIPLAFVSRTLSFALFILVAIIWFIPDSRIEKNMTEKK